jgi:hypothetical protein
VVTLLSALSSMVHTRSGQAVVHMDASYGCAARTESRRKRQKKNMYAAQPSSQNDVGMTSISTPRRVTRSQLEHEGQLVTPPSASNRFAATPPAKIEQRLRGRLPRCSDFGVARHYAFQNKGFYFCNPCDMWDALLPDCSRKVSGMSARSACIASHNTCSHPTSLRSEHCRTRCKTSIASPTETELVVSNYCSETREGDSEDEDEEDKDELLYYEGEDDSIDASYNFTTGTTTDQAKTSPINNNRVHDNGMISSSQQHAATSHNTQPNWYCNVDVMMLRRHCVCKGF